MGRTVDPQSNSFIQILLKLIPSEVIAVTVFLQGVMPQLLVPHLIVTAVLLAITPLYLSRVMGVKSRPQLVISTLSLAVWIYAIRGGPVQFIRYPYYQHWYGAVALALWTLIPPMFLTSPSAGQKVKPAASARRVGKGGRTAEGSRSGRAAPAAASRSTRAAPAAASRGTRAAPASSTPRRPRSGSAER